MRFSRRVSGGSWGGLGVVLVLWGGPWVGPGKSNDNIDVLAVQGFLCFFNDFEISFVFRHKEQMYVF